MLNKIKKFLCKVFGHSWHIAYNSEETWIICARCRTEEDIPESREQEAYEKIRNRDWNWIK